MNGLKVWPLLLFRTVMTVEAVMVFAQSVFAGGFLSGAYDLLDVHSVNATATAGMCLPLIVAAVLLWRPGGGPRWPIAAATALFLAEAGQIALGIARILAIHVPLGVAITVAVFFLLRAAWSPKPRQTETPGQTENEGAEVVEPAGESA